MKKIHIIIGASAAGIAAATKLRSLDKDCEIICIAAQKDLPYNKCLLVDYISKSIPREKLFLKPADFFEKNNIKLLLSTNVTKIMSQANKIELEDGKQLKYTNLLLALGTSPLVIPIKGLEHLKDYFTFQTLQDAEKIILFTKQNDVKNATIIGAGLTGVELADALSTFDIKVNLISREYQILPSCTDKEGAEFIENLIKKNEVTFYKNTTVQEIVQYQDKDKKIFTLKLSSGTNLKTDMLIFATGNIANIQLAQEAEITIQNGGIFTNGKMQTNFENIYAAGDVCLTKDIVTNNFIKSCTWPDAVMQAMVAASNMAGKTEKYQGILPTTSSNIFDTTFVSCGPISNPPKNSNHIIKKGDDFYHKFFTQNDTLIGFLLVGKIDNIGRYKNMILNKEKLQ